MSVTDSTTAKTPVEYAEESDPCRCAECGTPASRVADRAAWCVVCARPVNPPGDALDEDDDHR